MTRTLEVLPYWGSGTLLGWHIKESGRRSSSEIFDTKKEAKKEARSRAKRYARQNDHSVGVKIFDRGGEYQDQHVYEP